MKIKEDKEFPTSPTQGAEVVQGVAIAQEVNLANEASSCSVEAGERREGSQAWADASFTTIALKNDSTFGERVYQYSMSPTSSMQGHVNKHTHTT